MIRDAELQRLNEQRRQAKTLREMAESCVAIEEALGGRPPTRGFDVPPMASCEEMTLNPSRAYGAHAAHVDAGTSEAPDT